MSKNKDDALAQKKYQSSAVLTARIAGLREEHKDLNDKIKELNATLGTIKGDAGSATSGTVGLNTSGIGTLKGVAIDLADICIEQNDLIRRLIDVVDAWFYFTRGVKK